VLVNVSRGKVPGKWIAWMWSDVVVKGRLSGRTAGTSPDGGSGFADSSAALGPTAGSRCPISGSGGEEVHASRASCRGLADALADRHATFIFPAKAPRVIRCPEGVDWNLRALVGAGRIRRCRRNRSLLLPGLWWSLF
jgi:hypothetical protein